MVIRIVGFVLPVDQNQVSCPKKLHRTWVSATRDRISLNQPTVRSTMDKPTPRINAPLREKFIGTLKIPHLLICRPNGANHWETAASSRHVCPPRGKRPNPRQEEWRMFPCQILRRTPVDVAGYACPSYECGGSGGKGESRFEHSDVYLL